MPMVLSTTGLETKFGGRKPRFLYQAATSSYPLTHLQPYCLFFQLHLDREIDPIHISHLHHRSNGLSLQRS